MTKLKTEINKIKIREEIRETEIKIQEYKKEYKLARHLTLEEEKQLDDLIDCQIEDIKIKRS